ncbi:MAG: helix-turn-helix domain-containing protein [Archaeoglobaceae archaeon]
MVYLVILDMVQPDCPFILNSEKMQVTYYMTFWDFTDKLLLNRGYVHASDPEELNFALEEIKEEPNFVDLKVLEKEKNRAMIKTTIHFTEAMDIIKRNGGYIIGPFFIKKGREIWHIGFDDYESLQNALCDLERNHEFYIKKNSYINAEEFSLVLSNISLFVNLINSVRNLDLIERQILEFAIELGYFCDPRKIKLNDLSSYLNLSKGYISRKLRSAMKKILPQVLNICDPRNFERL